MVSEINPSVEETLEQLTWVPNSYRPDERIQVCVIVQFLPRKGWTLSRDIHAGGGPYQTGDPGRTLEEAIQKFQKRFKRYD